MQVGRDGDKWSHQSHWKFHLVQEALKQQFSLVPLPVTSEWMWSILILKPLHVTVWNRWFWIPVKICTFREESKDGIGCWDGCCRRQPGHHCPEDLGDVQQHHGGKKTLSVTASIWSVTFSLKVSAGDEIYKYDRQQQQSLLAAKPWEKDPHFFKVTLPIYKVALQLAFVGHQDLCFGSAENGYARKIGGQSWDHGTAVGKGWFVFFFPPVKFQF